MERQTTHRLAMQSAPARLTNILYSIFLLLSTACYQITLTITMTAIVLACVRHTLMRFSLPILLLCHKCPHMSLTFADYDYHDHGGGTGSTPGRTRTCNLRIRSPLLYPVELQVHLSLSVILYQNFRRSQRKSLLSHHLRQRGPARAALSRYAIRVYVKQLSAPSPPAPPL